MFSAIRNTAHGAAALGLCAGVAITTLVSGAKADIFTLNVSGTFQPSLVIGNGLGTCSPACTISGEVVVNNTFGAANGGFVSGSVTASGFSGMGVGPVGPFTSFFGMIALVGQNSPNTALGLDSEPGTSAFDLRLLFEAPEIPGSFAFYTGVQIPLSTDSIIDTSLGGLAPGFVLTSGSLTPITAVATPEPASIAVLGLGIIGILTLREKVYLNKESKS